GRKRGNGVGKLAGLEPRCLRNGNALNDQSEQRAKFLVTNMSIDSNAWHPTVVAETRGQLLKNSRSMHVLRHVDRQSYAVEIGNKKITLRCRRLVDDAKSDTGNGPLGWDTD